MENKLEKTPKYLLNKKATQLLLEGYSKESKLNKNLKEFDSFELNDERYKYCISLLKMAQTEKLKSRWINFVQKIDRWGDSDELKNNFLHL